MYNRGFVGVLGMVIWGLCGRLMRNGGRLGVKGGKSGCGRGRRGKEGVYWGRGLVGEGMKGVGR